MDFDDIEIRSPFESDFWKEWTDDRGTNKLVYFVGWVLTIVMLGLWVVTSMPAALIYTLFGILAGFANWIENANKQAALGASVALGSSRQLWINVAIGLVIGLVATGGIFSLFSLKPLAASQGDISNIVLFFQNAGINVNTSTVSLGLNLLFVVITAAFMEEVLFRGVLVPTFIFLSNSAIFGMLFANTLFGLFHLYAYGANPSQVIAAISFGIIVTVIDYACKSLAPGIMIHAVNNARAVGVF